MSNIQAIVTAAQQHAKVRQYRKGYYATCNPTREDRRPSLLFGENQSGKPWFKDMGAETDPAAILRAWGLNPDTLEASVNQNIKPQPGPRRQPKKRRIDFAHPNAVYNYTFADGTPSYQVRRFNFTRPEGTPDKEFIQYHWGPNGRWQAGRGETPELLYHLPEVAGSQRILIGEGETVVEALRSVGYVATTHAGGAKAIDKALPAYRDWLRDKDVIILPDNDQPGKDMAQALADGLGRSVASGATVDPALFGGPKADIADLIDRLKKELLSNEEIRIEVDQVLSQAQPWQRTISQKELERKAAAAQYHAEVKVAKEAIEAQRQARQAELERRWKAGDKVNFEGDEDIDPDYIEYKRGFFTNAKKWQDHVIAHWPDLDADEQFRIKTAENREARPGKCGEWRKKTIGNGQVVSTRWTCGLCPGCLKRSVWIYRRALNEIQGLPTEILTTGDLLPEVVIPDEEIDPDYIEYKRGFFTEVTGKFWANEIIDGRPYVKRDNPGGILLDEDDLIELERIRLARKKRLAEAAEAREENEPAPEAPRENAPPLPQVKGELSIVRIEGDQERRRLGRELRLAGVNYKAFPITLEDGPAYDFIVNDDRGDPLGLITDARIELWVKGVEGKRSTGPNKKQRPQGASGPLLPSLKKLQQRYREALPYEVVLPELDDEGQPVDPDIFALDLPDIGTTARLPGVTVEFEVHDAETLQAALLEIHQEQWRILGRRGAVNYGVCIHKKFYTRYSTLPRMLADFNAEQAAIRQRRRKK